MERERFTREQIKQETLGLLKEELSRRIADFFAYPFCLFLFSPIITYLTRFFLPEETSIFISRVIALVFLSLLLAFLLIRLCETISDISKMKKNRFFTFPEKLIGMQEGRERNRKYLISDPFAFPHMLYFSSCDRYKIPRGMNYKWSKLGGIPEYGVLRGSNVNDIFILVSTDNKRILLAYNTKLFELVD